MLRMIMLGVLVLVGCSPVRYTQKVDDEGIVAMPNNSPEYRAQAIELIQRHIGPDYEITSEDYEVKGSERELENRSTESSDKEYQFRYCKREPVDGWRRGAQSLPVSKLSLFKPGLGYVNRDENKGVVAVPSKRYREEALELIEKHLQSDYVIVLETKENSKYYIFYCKPSLRDEKPPYEPAWFKDDKSGRTFPTWIAGGIL